MEKLMLQDGGFHRAHGCIHSKLSSYQVPLGGSETELCWADQKKLPALELFQTAWWACERLAVFASHHAQALLHVDAKPEVCQELSYHAFQHK